MYKFLESKGNKYLNIEEDIEIIKYCYDPDWYEGLPRNPSLYIY